MTIRAMLASVCALLLTQAPAQAAWPDSGQLRSVDNVFKAYGASTPGCALGVYHDGAIAYARGYGMADLERGVRITPDSLFDVGSVSKQFSAAVLVNRAAPACGDAAVRAALASPRDLGVSAMAERRESFTDHAVLEYRHLEHQ